MNVIRCVMIISTIVYGFSLAGCKKQEPLGVDQDWIHDPDPVPTVSSDPIATPTPTSTPTPSSTPSPIPTAKLYIGPAEVEKYVQKFVDDGKIQNVDVSPNMSNPTLEIQISSLDSYGSSVIGLCETGGGKRRVTFDPDFWNGVTDTQRELLAHHELGHCVLYRGHRSDLLDFGAYASIMYPVIMSSGVYTNNYSYYQQELFLWNAAQQNADTTKVVRHICNETDL